MGNVSGKAAAGLRGSHANQGIKRKVHRRAEQPSPYGNRKERRAAAALERKSHEHSKL